MGSILSLNEPSRKAGPIQIEHRPAMRVLPRTRKEKRQLNARAQAHLGVVLLCVVFAGCASIRNGRTQSVEVSSVPAGARVLVDGVPGGVTPTVLELPRKTRQVEIGLEMDGYAGERVMLSRRASRWVMGNAGVFAPFLLNQGFNSYGPVLLGYFIAVAASMGVDFMNGSAYEQRPEGVHIVLTPTPPKPD